MVLLHCMGDIWIRKALVSQVACDLAALANVFSVTLIRAHFLNVNALSQAKTNHGGCSFHYAASRLYKAKPLGFSISVAIITTSPLFKQLICVYSFVHDVT
jgi:hypothetical protein